MNYLAHVYLSGDNEELIIGNYIADGLKGIHASEFNPGIQRGISLHRHIDNFTDSHEHVRTSKKRLVEKYGHYSSVIVDVFYDHFLAKNWSDYSNEALIEYEKRIYDLLILNQEILPIQTLYFLDYMVDQKLLSNYATIQTIANSLSGLAKRTRFISNMEYAVGDLEEHYGLFEADFRSFFPQLEKSVSEFLKGMTEE